MGLLTLALTSDEQVVMFMDFMKEHRRRPIQSFIINVWFLHLFSTITHSVLLAKDKNDEVAYNCKSQRRKSPYLNALTSYIYANQSSLQFFTGFA